MVARYHYGPWGELLYIANGSNADVSSDSTHIANINPIRYRGYYYDTETGFYFLQSRYYDPQTHRFINADGYISTGQGILGYNMYAYCNNNPIQMAISHFSLLLQLLELLSVESRLLNLERAYLKGP